MSEITMLSVMNRNRQRKIEAKYGEHLLNYPLYTSYQEEYNYENLKNAIKLD